MKKEKLTWKHFINFKNLIVLLVSLALGSLIFVIYCALKEGQFNIYNAADGSFVAATVLLCFSLMYVVLNHGTFDVIAVGFSNVFSFMKKDGTKKYDGLYEYSELKKEKRNKNRFVYLPILIGGLIFLIVAICLRLEWSQNV